MIHASLSLIAMYICLLNTINNNVCLHNYMSHSYEIHVLFYYYVVRWAFAVLIATVFLSRPRQGYIDST